MITVQIDLSHIRDWPAFHAEFKQKMGFPEYYGNNLYAWIDCMSDHSRPDQPGMTEVEVPRGEHLVLEMRGFPEWQHAYPELSVGFL